MHNTIRALAPLTLAAVLSGGAAGAAPPPPAQAPAPVGVFGADMPPAGKFVFSFTPSFTQMQGSRIDTQSVSSSYIVTDVISPYTPIGTHLLRLAPKSLSVNSQGFAVAYGLTPDITLFASTAVIEKAVDMQAFKGLSGSTSLGFSTGRTAGLGDTTLATIVRVAHDRTHRLNLNIGLSLPTGSTTDLITLLLPNGTAPAKRGFYAMQPGTGTVDALVGATYSGVQGPWSWGGSYRARVPLDRNPQGWAYGDLHEANAWGGYTWLPGLETTFRVNGTVQGHIRGEDFGIRGYAQGGDPFFYGGEQISLYGGVIVGGRFVGVPAAQLGVEAGAPVYQRLNGPQLGRAWQVNVALKYKL